MAKQYETVIGLEVHVELATKTKIFCSCSTQFGGAPNTHTCPVCTGMPGSLPVLNRQVVEYAAAVGLATNCQINQYCKFDRKNYFYPDNPQNYQISQLYLPICRDGYVEIETGPDKQKKKIGIHEIHMEEDAGKLIHDEWEDCSLVDYNRSGVPLIEIVSEPDIRSAEEVIAYLEKLRLLIQYLGASDCKLQEGSMREMCIRDRTCVSMGNPHAVVFVENVEDLNLEELGPQFEGNPCFPNRVNTEFIQVLDENRIRMRVWERGSGETFACGTGACAAVVASVLNGFTKDCVTVELLGGCLEIEWDTKGDTVFMTGPAATVFHGEIDVTKLEE